MILPNNWCKAFFKMDKDYASYEKEIKHLKETQRYWIVYPCGNNQYEVRKGDDSFDVNIENRTCVCKWWDLSDGADESGIDQDASDADPSGLDPIDVDPTIAGPSDAGPSYAGDTSFSNKSKASDTAKIIEDAIATERLKTVGLKRRCKYKRIAKRDKAYQFGKDGAGYFSKKE
nr:leucine-rich repeat-containing protein [Tanacetum cinerariifolium]